jgi:hypothetical protein
MPTHKVGGEVDAFCTKCRMTLAHTILAMVVSRPVRVQCNTCGGQHAYRKEPGAGTRAPGAPRAPAPRKVVISFEQRLSERDQSKARPYSPKETFAMDELVSHPTFGLGFVTVVRQDKIDVAFKAFEKTLVHGRGEGGGARPAFSPPAARAAGPADKPVSPQNSAPAAPAPESPPSPDGESPGV